MEITLKCENITPGTVILRKRDGAEVRIMAFSDNWLMMRLPGRVPFCRHWQDVKRDYEPEIL